MEFSATVFAGPPFFGLLRVIMCSIDNPTKSAWIAISWIKFWDFSCTICCLIFLSPWLTSGLLCCHFTASHHCSCIFSWLFVFCFHSANSFLQLLNLLWLLCHRWFSDICCCIILFARSQTNKLNTRRHNTETDNSTKNLKPPHCDAENTTRWAGSLIKRCNSYLLYITNWTLLSRKWYKHSYDSGEQCLHFMS